MTKVDTAEVEQIEDLLERLLAADTAMETGSQVLLELQHVRVAVLRELVRINGGSATTDLLNIQRTGLYQAIRQGISSSELERRDEEIARQEKLRRTADMAEARYRMA